MTEVGILLLQSVCVFVVGIIMMLTKRTDPVTDAIGFILVCLGTVAFGLAIYIMAVLL